MGANGRKRAVLLLRRGKRVLGELATAGSPEAGWQLSGPHVSP
jgi:hypothetical protein